MQLQKKQNGQRKILEEAINAVIKVITNALVAGEKLSIVGFGTFEVAERAERQGRNPKTNETITIAACKAPKFKPAKALKELINA